MFGKGKKMSSNDRFVMMKGREAGNIAKIKPDAKAGTGKKVHPNAKPAAPTVKRMDKANASPVKGILKARTINQTAAEFDHK